MDTGNSGKRLTATSRYVLLINRYEINVIIQIIKYITAVKTLDNLIFLRKNFPNNKKICKDSARSIENGKKILYLANRKPKSETNNDSNILVRGVADNLAMRLKITNEKNKATKNHIIPISGIVMP